jgi:hypothetical protein
MKIKNYKDLLNTVILFMILIFIFKSLSVLYYSSRNISYGFPFDSFGFETFHRFTDYLIIWEQSASENIYKLGTPAPYGFLQFLLFKILPFKNYSLFKYINFLFLLTLFIYINFKIFIHRNNIKLTDSLILFLTFIALNYPLFYLIDRGNLDIYPAIILSLLVYRCITDKKNNQNLFNAILIGILICLKPSFGLFLFILIFYFPLKYIFTSISMIIFFYLVPVVFYGADFFYIFKSIMVARGQLGLPTIFCHNALCGLRTIGLTPNVYFSFGFGILLLSYFYYCARKTSRLNDKSQILYLYLLTATVATLIINDPSPDYRLVFLIPFLLGIKEYFLPALYKNFEMLIILLCIIFIFSFSNIYFKSFSFEYFTFLRFLGVIGFFQIVMLGTFRRLKRKVNIN